MGVSRAGGHDLSSECLSLAFSLFEIFSGAIEFGGIDLFIKVGSGAEEFLVSLELVPWFVEGPSAVGGWVEFGSLWEERVFESVHQFVFAESLLLLLLLLVWGGGGGGAIGYPGLEFFLSDDRLAVCV